jgi:uncharacterized membrane protein
VREQQVNEIALPSIWLKRTVILLILLGIFFRFFNLDRKVYWLDETFTSLRLSGYTQAELVQQTAGENVSAEFLQRYQHLNAERGLADTFKGLALEEPQMTPLYFTLTRLWAQGFGDSVGAIRGLSALISLFAFPCLGWLCLELFQAARVAWMALALFAVSPLQVLYAQEARPYSLWTVMILLSSAVLLWAIRASRRPSRRPSSRLSWAIYAATVALGLYTHLLFGFVMAAHAVYVIAAPASKKRSPILPYGLATAAGSLALVPWLMVLSRNVAQAAETTASLRKTTSFSFLFHQWLISSSRVFIGWDLGFVNLLVVLGLLYGLYFLCANVPKQTWLFILALVAVPFLALALPDLLLEGGRSARIRYLIPSYVGMQIALAYLFSSLAIRVSSNRWRQAALMGLVSINIIACGVSAQAQIWWNKSVPRSSYYAPVSALINQAESPLVMSDGAPMEVLAFSRWLDPDVQLQLVKRPKAARVAGDFDAVFLLNPSKRLQAILVQRNYSLKLIYKDRKAPEESEDRLWQVEK